jgi:hypothetical protein
VIRKITNISSFVVLAVLAYLPFHTPISTAMIDVFGGKLPIKGLKEAAILLIVVPMFVVILKKWKLVKDANHTLGILIGAYFLLYIFMALVRSDKPIVEVAGLIASLRYLGFFVICYFVARLVQNVKLFEDRAVRIVLYGGLFVIVFGALQVLVLPKDFLTILGYGADTVKPYLTIDNNESLVRILSTLSGPNPLGAYLTILLPIGIYYGRKKKWQWYVWPLIAIPFLITLYGSGSRSGVIGCAASLFVYFFLLNRKNKKLWVASGALVVLGSIGIVARDSNFIQVTLLHRDPAEASQVDSDDQRLSSLSLAIDRIQERPLGHGVGSSGPASNYGDNSFIIENYYLDIAYQVGWIGMLLFLSIIGYTGLLLYRLKSKVAYSLLAGLVGVSIIGLFWPVWISETVALTWWGLAGIVIGVQARRLHHTQLSDNNSQLSKRS